MKDLLHRYGFDIVRYPYRSQILKRRMQLISSYGINLIFDVGANIGQYAMQIRDIGYKARIVSFEPLTSAYKELKKNSNNDSLWDTVNIALGHDNYKSEINISVDSYSSSILDLLPIYAKVTPKSKYTGKQIILIRKIDKIIDKYYQKSDKLFLKIDTQGYESKVIEGAKNSMDKIIGIQLEMSIIPMYNGGLIFTETIDLLYSKGYVLMSLEPGFSDPNTGQLIQFDGIFFRKCGIVKTDIKKQNQQ